MLDLDHSKHSYFVPMISCIFGNYYLS